MELSTVAQFRAAFYRLLGVESTDDALLENSETANEVADIYLTGGLRDAQRWMLDCGYGGWRKRSSALTWSGTDAADGGRYSALPDDFLRTCGSVRQSALREANGDRWGQEITDEENYLKGDYYYVRGSQLWLARSAAPPTVVYLEYHYTHPKFETGVTFDFPVDARMLAIAEAANAAKEEAWLPSGQETEQKIERALARARQKARGVCRQTKSPRVFQRPTRYSNRW